MANFIQTDMGFILKSNSPLDKKQEFTTKEEMKNFDTSWLGNTAMATCDEDGNLYVYNINNTESDTTGKWKVVEGGSGESGASINDTQISNTTTYSSEKIETDFVKAEDSHTHDNKEVLDLLSESNEGKLQYNGVAIGGANSADEVAYINDTILVTNVEEALNKLIDDYYYVAPSITTFTATPVGGVFEEGTVISAPTFTWEYNKEVTTQTLTDCTLADETVRTATYDTDITSNKIFILSASDGKESVSKSISYTFVYPYYTGVSTTDTLTETDIAALTKKVAVKGTQTINYTTSQSYMVFAYPSSYGTISSIIDQNGFNITDSFIQTTITINSVEYYVLCSNKCSGSYKIKFVY